MVRPLFAPLSVPRRGIVSFTDQCQVRYTVLVSCRLQPEEGCRRPKVPGAGDARYRRCLMPEVRRCSLRLVLGAPMMPGAEGTWCADGDRCTEGIAEEDNGQVLASRFLMPCVTRRPYCRAQRGMSWLGAEGRWKSKVPSLERCGGQLDRASVSLDNASLIIDFASLSIALVRCALYKVVPSLGCTCDRSPCI